MAKKTISSGDTFQEDLPNQSSEKSRNLVTKLIVICLIFSLLAAVMSIFVGVKVSKIASADSDLKLAASRMGIVTGETEEDHVMIDDRYTIQPTTKISEAYRKGKASGLDEEQKEVLNIASGTLSNLIKNDMNSFEKEKAVYTWMCSNLELAASEERKIPVASSKIDEPYGVLQSGTGVSVGFATTFRMFMEMLGIPCKVVHDTEFTTAWNEVQLDDDNWYFVDIGKDVVYNNYENFNLNDTLCAYDHQWDTEYFPKANGTKYCYALTKTQDLKDLYKIPSYIKKAYDKKQSCLFLTFQTKAGNDLEIVDELVSRSTDSLGGKLSDDNASAKKKGRGVADVIVVPMDGSYLLGVFFGEASQNNNSGLSKKEYNKISKAVAKAFPAVG